MKSNKYTLLDKSENQGQILEESSAPFRNKRENGAPYTLLEDDWNEKDLDRSQQPKPASNNSKNSTIPQKTSQMNYPPPQMKTITYDLSQVKNSVVHIGASGVTVQPRAPYIPPVLIECSKCKTKQQIPGNAHEFICYGCHQNEKVQPKFGIFICGVCHNHVSYPYRTSDHIQCNYCFTVNRVPIEPLDATKSKIQKEEAILPKDLREEEVILNENIDYPDMTTARGQEQQREKFE